MGFHKGRNQMSRLSKYVKEKIVKVLVAALVVGTVAGNGTLTVQAEEAALLEDLRLGGGDVFYYTPPDGEAEEKAGSERPSCRIAAWPLPDALAQGWHEEQGEDILGLVEKAGQKLVLEKAARDAAVGHRL